MFVASGLMQAYELSMGDGGDSQLDVYRQVNLKDVVSIKGRLQTVED